jgi:DNA modification methylase
MAKAPPPTIAIEFVPVGDLSPYERNSRKHGADQVANIVKLITEFGWTRPILRDDKGTILAGHGALMAAKEIYAVGGRIRMFDGTAVPKGAVPAITARGWSAKQKRAYVIADNRIGEQSTWDKDALRFELDWLKGQDFDMDLTMFSSADLRGLFAGADGKTDPDDVPAVEKTPVAKPGDIWLLGEHRIACGDCTDKALIERLFAGATPHLMVTDPPYGVEYDAAWRLERGLNKAHQKRAEGKVLNDDRADWREAWALFPGAVAYVWHASLKADDVLLSLKACEFEPRAHLIWSKPSILIGRGNYQWQHEPCWYVVRKGRTAHWEGDRKQSTVWDIQNMHATQGSVDDGKTEHSTQKPVECMERPIRNNSKVGDFVYEPFSGSGTTIIAAQKTARKCLAVELNPLYVDLAIRRWQAFTGLSAKREGDGVTFDQLLPVAA